MNKDAQFKCRILHSFELDSINKVKHNLNTALQYIRSIFKLDDMRHLQWQYVQFKHRVIHNNMSEYF